eukprot:TRINITY_DN2337_c0_g2_i6.p1 TRINITY_DN2337_c0_g2~~TRINITY_DN2337_c0_g2_i6.p1  ORF type:complete len:355 (+),score=88.12 TRINITY_DN2337_c0_g2_i6:51-1115(+)
MMSRQDVSFHRPIDYFAGTTEAKKERARKLYEREKMNDGLEGKLRARYLKGREGDKEFATFVDSQIRQMLTQRQLHEKDLKHLDELLGPKQPRSSSASRLSTAASATDRRNDPANRPSSVQSRRAMTPQTMNLQNSGQLGVRGDWMTIASLQAESERKDKEEQARKLKQIQLENRRNLDQQIHEKRDRLVREKELEILQASHEREEVDRWRREDEIREEERRRKEVVNAESLRTQIEKQRQLAMIERAKLKHEEQLDIEFQVQQELLTRQLEAQRRSEYRRHCQDDIRINREGRQRTGDETSFPNPSYSASILVDTTDDDRIRQMKDRLRKNEEKQEAIALGMSSYIHRMKQAS